MSLANDFFSNFRSLIKSCGTLFSLFPQEGRGRQAEGGVRGSRSLCRRSDGEGEGKEGTEPVR